MIKNNGILVLKDVQFNNGCIINVDNGGKLIVLGNLINRNNSNAVYIDGNLTIEGSLTNGTGGEISGSGTIIADTIKGECCIMGWDPDSIPDNGIIIDSIIGNILHVTLLYMNIKKDDQSNEVIIEWMTASETNNDYFTIFKSKDLKTWKHVSKESGSGNTNIYKEYSIRDEYENDYIYYKLTQTDYNGHQDVLSIKAMQYRYVNESPQIQIIPNPSYVDEYILICCVVINSVKVYTYEG